MPEDGQKWPKRVAFLDGTDDILLLLLLLLLTVKFYQFLTWKQSFKLFLRDFRLPLRCKSDLRSLEILRSVEW